MKLPKHAEIWLPGYVASRFRRLLHREQPKRVWLMIADHFEPYWRNTDDEVALKRVMRWRKEWPEIAKRHVDSVGNHPQYTFFYPEEEYRPELLDLLAEIKDIGFGDVEVHLHHDNDTESAFIDKLSKYKDTLFNKHGLLRKRHEEIIFGFIHGNWCLDNSHPEGKYCGLNNEITLLKQLGCYADFTMPCGPSPMQSPLLNTIYWAIDDPVAPKSYNKGKPFSKRAASNSDLLMIQGPWGLLLNSPIRINIEIGELAYYNPLTKRRVSTWLDVSPRIGADIYVKLFTHGTQETTTETLLSETLNNLFKWFIDESAARNIQPRFVSAYQMFNHITRTLDQSALTAPALDTASQH